MTEVIRPLQMEDVASVVLIEKQVQQHPWTHQLFSESVQGDDQCWICTRGQLPVGYAVIKVICDEAELLTLAVAPESQGQGVGRRLLSWIKKQAKKDGVTQLFLEVRKSNHIAISLYLSCGFIQTGQRRNYYPCSDGSREDAWVLSATL